MIIFLSNRSDKSLKEINDVVIKYIVCLSGFNFSVDDKVVLSFYRDSRGNVIAKDANNAFFLVKDEKTLIPVESIEELEDLLDKLGR